MAELRVSDFAQACTRAEPPVPLELLAGKDGLERVIAGPDLNRPGLALAGHFVNFAPSRIQIFGRGESAFAAEAYARAAAGDGAITAPFAEFFSYKPACCVFTHGAPPPPALLELAGKNGVACFGSPLSTADLVRHVEAILDERFAPRATVHGVLMEVFGVGVLLTGKSGIGKSECALELIQRGHRLIADDAVEFRCLAGSMLIGSGLPRVMHHMEIRGLGIINVSMLFGVGAIRDRKRLQLVVHLEAWEAGKEYERIGLDEYTYEMLGVRVPLVTLPVAPARNIPVIIETAAMNHRLKKLGFHSAREFDRRLREIMERQSMAREGLGDGLAD